MKGQPFDSTTFFNNNAMQGLLQKLDSVERELAKFVMNQQTINNRLNCVEEQINLPGDPQKSIGDIVAINSSIIQEINQSLSQKADREIVTQEVQRVNDFLLGLKERLENGQSHMAQKLESNMKELRSDSVQDITALRDDFEYRIDRNENSLKAHSKFIRHTAPALKQVELSVDELRKFNSEVKERLQTHDDGFREIKAKVENRKEIIVLNERLKSLSIKLLNAADADHVSTLEASIDKTKEAIQNIKEVTNAQEIRVKRLEKSSCKTDDVKKKFVMQQHLHQLLDKLRAEVDNKACQKSVEDLSCTIDNLTEDYLLTRNKVKISSEFVDWFTQRGEAYEHNMNAVDNHLKELAAQSAESKYYNYLKPPHSRKQVCFSKYEVPDGDIAT